MSEAINYEAFSSGVVKVCHCFVELEWVAAFEVNAYRVDYADWEIFTMERNN